MTTWLLPSIFKTGLYYNHYSLGRDQNTTFEECLSLYVPHCNTDTICIGTILSGSFLVLRERNSPNPSKQDPLRRYNGSSHRCPRAEVDTQDQSCPSVCNGHMRPLTCLCLLHSLPGGVLWDSLSCSFSWLWLTTLHLCPNSEGLQFCLSTITILQLKFHWLNSTFLRENPTGLTQMTTSGPTGIV
jgi:hypothetical protein